jgi:hypothetical protein
VLLLGLCVCSPSLPSWLFSILIRFEKELSTVDESFFGSSDFRLFFVFVDADDDDDVADMFVGDVVDDAVDADASSRNLATLFRW